MTEPTEPIEAVIAQLKTKCDFGVQNDLSVVAVDPFIVSRLLDYVEGMRAGPLGRIAAEREAQTSREG